VGSDERLSWRDFRVIARRAARRGDLDPDGVRAEIARRRALVFEEGGALLKALFGAAVETLARLSRALHAPAGATCRGGDKLATSGADRAGPRVV
jgi:sigma54-dependent transcription regulator